MIDAIDDKTLEYSGNGGLAVGGFTWSGHFTWREVPIYEGNRRNSSTEYLRYTDSVIIIIIIICLLFILGYNLLGI